MFLQSIIARLAFVPHARRRTLAVTSTFTRFLLLFLSIMLSNRPALARNERTPLLSLLPSPSLLSPAKPLPLGASIETISEHFLGSPFRDSALGEGEGEGEGEGDRESAPSGKDRTRALYDSDPKFRIDAFDCTTFVETVWAMSFSKPPLDWTQSLQTIRYREGVPSFVNRLHFVSLDWMPYQIARGALVDITALIGPPLSQSLTLIDRKAWYKKLHPSELKNFETRFPQEVAQRVLTTYLSFSALLDAPLAVSTLKNELKKGALLVNFIRPDWDTVRWIGTRIDVSHQGFLLVKGDEIMMRHASAPHRQVIETNFLEYIRYHRHHPSLKGIQVVRILTL